jgi:hypothetical protein
MADLNALANCAAFIPDDPVQDTDREAPSQFSFNLLTPFKDVHSLDMSLEYYNTQAEIQQSRQYLAPGFNSLQALRDLSVHQILALSGKNLGSTSGAEAAEVLKKVVFAFFNWSNQPWSCRNDSLKGLHTLFSPGNYKTAVTDGKWVLNVGKSKFGTGRMTFALSALKEWCSTSKHPWALQLLSIVNDDSFIDVLKTLTGAWTDEARAHKQPKRKSTSPTMELSAPKAAAKARRTRTPIHTAALTLAPPLAPPPSPPLSRSAFSAFSAFSASSACPPMEIGTPAPPPPPPDSSCSAFSAFLASSVCPPMDPLAKPLPPQSAVKPKAVNSPAPAISNFAAPGQLQRDIMYGHGQGWATFLQNYTLEHKTSITEDQLRAELAYERLKSKQLSMQLIAASGAAASGAAASGAAASGAAASGERSVDERSVEWEW